MGQHAALELVIPAETIYWWDYVIAKYLDVQFDYVEFRSTNPLLDSDYYFPGEKKNKQSEAVMQP